MRSFIPATLAAVLLLGPAAAFAQVTQPGSNPPGTAAGRALDRAAGTNLSGAYPSQSDGTPGNPPGTAVGRALDRADGKTTSRAPAHTGAHGTRAAAPGTAKNNAATRSVDRAAGTNNSGAYPSQSDGTPGNPPGTAVSRALGTTGTK